MDHPNNARRDRKRHITSSIIEQRIRNIHSAYRTFPENFDDSAAQSRMVADRGPQRPLSPIFHRPTKSSLNFANFKEQFKRKQRPNQHGPAQFNKQQQPQAIQEDSLNEFLALKADEHLSKCHHNSLINNDHPGDDDILIEVKRRLSLPSETSIPKSFLHRHKDRLISLYEEGQPSISRQERRQSLAEIGFGQLSTYVKSYVLGSGTYSTVYKGFSRLTNKPVALKEIHLEREEGVPFTAIREVSLLKQLKHNNIVTLHDIIYTCKTLTLVFEFVDRDLSHYMTECDLKINTLNVRLFLYQLLRGLKFCHDRRILHRDLKPQNILISLGGELKLADFGLARAKSVPTKTFTNEVVTLWYRPPDVLLGNIEYGTSIDMWGVGCIFFEMAAGYTLFTGIYSEKQIECIFDIIGTPTELEWPGINTDLKRLSIELPPKAGRDLASMAPRLDLDGINLLRSFLKCNPRNRISSKDALNHKYFITLPPSIHNLPDTMSIFSLPGVGLAPEVTRVPSNNIEV